MERPLRSHSRVLAEEVGGVKAKTRRGGGRHGHHDRHWHTEVSVRTQDGLPVQFSLERR